MGVSLVTSALFFPFLVWGGFVFLPFDAPLLDGAPLRLVYTLRCSVFAAAPIVLGEYNHNKGETASVQSSTVDPDLSHLSVSPVSPVSPVCLRLAGLGRHSAAGRCVPASV